MVTIATRLLPSLKATSHIILLKPLLFLTRTCLRPPRHSTITDRITRCLQVLPSAAWTQASEDPFGCSQTGLN
jgi:hypothetical protein